MSKDIILIIGASSDIGISLIKSIKSDSLILAHYHSSSDELKEISRIIDNKLILLKADLSIEVEVHELIKTIEADHGVPNKIVHLAAPKFENVRFKNIVWNDFQNELDISLKSIVLILGNFLPKMAKIRKGKVVIMLSSVVVNVPPKALSQYTIIKYAMLGLVKSLASEYSDKNVQINSISPSMVNTKFLDNINSKFVELNAYAHPLKRNAAVDEISPIIATLISKDSDYINGVNIPITGGSVF